MKDELTYLRISRDRARVVLLGCKRVLADEDFDERDLMTIAATLRDNDHPTPWRPVHAELADLVMGAVVNRATAPGLDENFFEKP